MICQQGLGLETIRTFRETAQMTAQIFAMPRSPCLPSQPFRLCRSITEAKCSAEVGNGWLQARHGTYFFLRVECVRPESADARNNDAQHGAVSEALAQPPHRPFRRGHWASFKLCLYGSKQVLEERIIGGSLPARQINRLNLAEAQRRRNSIELHRHQDIAPFSFTRFISYKISGGFH